MRSDSPVAYRGYSCWSLRCSPPQVPSTTHGRSEGNSSQTRLLDGLSPPFTVSSSMFPFVCLRGYQNPHSKVFSCFLAFSACFVVLSISIEGLFFLSYSVLLVMWVEIEAAIWSPSSHTKKMHRGRDGSDGDYNDEDSQVSAQSVCPKAFSSFFCSLVPVAFL